MLEDNADSLRWNQSVRWRRSKIQALQSIIDLNHMQQLSHAFRFNRADGEPACELFILHHTKKNKTIRNLLEAFQRRVNTQHHLHLKQKNAAQSCSSNFKRSKCRIAQKKRDDIPKAFMKGVDKTLGMVVQPVHIQ